MTRNYKQYSDFDIIEESKKVTSLSKLLKALGLKQAGGNFINMKKHIQRLNIDTSHWKGQGWSKGDQLKDYSNYNKFNSIRKHLLKDRGNKCEQCGISEWLGLPVKIEVDHIDGNRTNNQIINLKLLCPNCHSVTPTWRKQKHLLV